MAAQAAIGGRSRRKDIGTSVRRDRGSARPSGPLGRSISTMDLGMSGKVALVTAASKGLGRGAALAMSREGARVAICARSPGPLEATAAELPGAVLAIPARDAELD